MMQENSDVDEGVEILETSHQFPCPSCGGAMVFSPKTQGLTCAYCDNVIDLQAQDTTIIEYPLSEAEAFADHNWGEDKVVIHCEQCGGQTLVNATFKASQCVFCGSSHVISQTEGVGIKPESVLPFGVTKAQARLKFKAWINKRMYAPRPLKQAIDIENLKGIYIPFFTYDSDTHTAFTAKRGVYYYTTRTTRVNGKTVTKRVRHTRWRTVHGVYDKYYDDILVNSSKKVDDKLVSKMGGFDHHKLKPYRPEYLSGYLAERYSLSLKDGWDKGRNRVDDLIHHGIREKVGGDEFRLLNRSTNYGEVQFKHLLLPLYMASFTYRDKIYHFIIQGSSGQVVSEYPKSVLKILATLVGALLLMALIYYLVFYGQASGEDIYRVSLI